MVDCGQEVCYNTYNMLGTYPHILDDKNRIRIPAKLKDGFKDNGFKDSYTLTKGVDGCIYVFAKETLLFSVALHLNIVHCSIYEVIVEVGGKKYCVLKLSLS